MVVLLDYFLISDSPDEEEEEGEGDFPTSWLMRIKDQHTEATAEGEPLSEINKFRFFLRWEIATPNFLVLFFLVVPKSFLVVILTFFSLYTTVLYFICFFVVVWCVCLWLLVLLWWLLIILLFIKTTLIKLMNDLFVFYKVSYTIYNIVYF